MHEIETWAPGSAACALCVINISGHVTGRPAGRGGGGGPGPMGPPPGSATDILQCCLAKTPKNAIVCFLQFLGYSAYYVLKVHIIIIQF